MILEGLGVNMASPRVLTGAAYGGAKIDVASAAGMHCQVGMFAMLSRSVAVPQSDSSLHYPLLTVCGFRSENTYSFFDEKISPVFPLKSSPSSTSTRVCLDLTRT